MSDMKCPMCGRLTGDNNGVAITCDACLLTEKDKEIEKLKSKNIIDPLDSTGSERMKWVKN